MRRILFACLLASIPTSAFAKPSEADALIEQGLDLREAGKDVEALAKFKQAYELSKSPRAQAQIGLAQQALGQWLDAEKNLGEALAQAKDPWIKARKAALEDAQRAIGERLGSLEVLGTPGARLTLNGSAVGMLPLSAGVRVVAGAVTIELEKEGYLPVSRSVTVPGGSLSRETVELVKRPEVAATPPPPPPPTMAPPLPVTTPPPAVTTHDSGSSFGTYALIAGGVGVAALGTGIAFLFVRNGHVNSYNDDTVCLAGGLTRDENCKAELDSANSAQTLMTVGFIGAGVLGAAAVALFALDPGDEATASLDVGVDPFGKSVVLSGRF